MYFLKKLNAQELGYRNKTPNKAGRYILISNRVDDFFPHLSKTVLNDTIVIPMVTPLSDGKIYAKLVYHNSKFVENKKNGRNEVRLYINTILSNNKALFEVDDIIVIRKVLVPTTISDFGYIYAVYIYNQKDEHYSQLNHIINDYREIDKKGSHALYGDVLDFLPIVEISEEMKVVISDDIVESIEKEQAALRDKISTETEDDVDSLENLRGASLFHSVSFRDFVLFAYNYKCAITGKAISYKSLNNIEAAHIKPKAQEGTFLPCNGIALCRDMHWAFDKGFITLSDNYEIIVHEMIKDTLLDEFAGKKIFIPAIDYFKPEVKFIQYHRENIFGLFLHSGGIRSL